MKNIILPILIIFLALSGYAFADIYCQWDGSTPQACRSTSLLPSGQQRMIIPIISDNGTAEENITGMSNIYEENGMVVTNSKYGLPIIVDEKNANDHGYYRVLTDWPEFNEAVQKYGDVKYTFENNQIIRTWPIEDKTEDEKNEYKSQALSLETYAVLKWLIKEGVITSTNIQNAPQALKDAYLARQALKQ